MLRNLRSIPKVYAAFARTKVTNVTSEQMCRDLLKDSRPTVLHFRKADCASCNNLSPVIEQLSNQNENIQFATVDIDQCKSIAQEYNIKGTPSVAAFLRGEHVDTVSDVDHSSLNNVINQLHRQVQNECNNITVKQTITRTMYPSANDEQSDEMVVEETEEITITGDGARLPERGLANQPAQDFMDHEMAHHNKQVATQQGAQKKLTTKKQGQRAQQQRQQQQTA